MAENLVSVHDVTSGGSVPLRLSSLTPSLGLVAMRRHIANVLVISLAAGCGTKTPATEGAAAAPTPAAAPAAAVGQPSRSTSRDVITRAEIEQVRANTVYDVVNRLRPNFLRVEGRLLDRGSGVSV